MPRAELLLDGSQDTKLLLHASYVALPT